MTDDSVSVIINKIITEFARLSLKKPLYLNTILIFRIVDYLSNLDTNLMNPFN